MGKAEDILGKMTLDQKAWFLTAGAFACARGIEELGVNELILLDGGPGINIEQLFTRFYEKERPDRSYKLARQVRQKFFDLWKAEEEDKDTADMATDEEYELYQWLLDRLESVCTLDKILPPACFPSGMAMGSTWNENMVAEVASAVANEAAAYGINILLGTPFVNIVRDPRAGRAFEAYSEDPYLNARLSSYVIKPIQARGVAANVKHFAANNQEYNRVGINEIISKRAMEEIYLPAFKAAINEGVATVMSAYNSINGVKCTESVELLQNKLRKEYGFKGTVMSDYGAVRNSVSAVKAGNDMILPTPPDFDKLKKAVENGDLKEEIIDRSVLNILNLAMDYSDVKCKYTSADEVGRISDKAALRAAQEGIVLLKNDDNIFPLKGKISLIAEDDGYLFDCGTGSAGIDTSKKFSLLEELKAEFGGDKIAINTIYPDTKSIIVVVRLIGMEGNDRKDLKLPEKELNRIHNTIRYVRQNGNKIKIGVVLNVAAPVDVSEFAGEVDGIICTFLPGMMGSRALAQILSGSVCPSGRLPVSFPFKTEDLPTFINFPGDGNNVNYGEDIYVGYRYYNTKKVRVMYPFGYGLSYTRFEYGDINVSSKTFDGSLDMSVKVKNVGDMTGSEVVQLYIRDVNSSIRKPERELKRFKKVKLKPGESTEVVFNLKKKDFESFDMDLDRWEAEEGDFDIIIGRDARTTIKEIRVTGDWKSAYSYSSKSKLKDIYENEELRERLYQLFEELGSDSGVVDSEYEYTSYHTVREALARVADMNSPEVVVSLKVFDEELESVNKH